MKSRLGSAVILIAVLCAPAYAGQGQRRLGPDVPPDLVSAQDDMAGSSTAQEKPGEGENQSEKSLFDLRLDREREALRNPFTLIPHKPNYILPAAYNFSPNEEPNSLVNGALMKLELKFQFSFKARFPFSLLHDNGFPYFGYTQQSYWQAYNFRNSSPFRETNYEPEFPVYFFTNGELLGFKNRLITVCPLDHQSNGLGGDMSRSWNRAYVDFLFERGNFYVSIRPWYRYVEGAAKDDNPDIIKYMGHGEASFYYGWGDQRIGLMLRNNFRSDNKGAIQIDRSGPIGEKWRWYVQYFNGYGESLIDYKHSVNRLSLGVLLSDWL